MNQLAILFEEATRETLKRWRNTEGQSQNAERNIELAIINALNQNNYNGFTRKNNARQKIIEIGEAGIKYSLLYNMLQLNSYRNQRINCDLGNVNAYVTLVSEQCKRGQIQLLEQMLDVGISEIFKRQTSKTNQDTKDYEQAAYEFADAVLRAYSWYNTSYHTVSAKEPMTSPYDIQASKILEQYYQEQLLNLSTSKQK